MRVLSIAPTGAGKGTQGALIALSRRCDRWSTTFRNTHAGPSI